MSLKPLAELTDRETVDELSTQTLRAQVRREIISGIGAIEQASAQRKPLGIVEQRRRELMLAEKVITLVLKNVG